MSNKEIIVTLTPVAMVVPNEAGVYALSRIRKPKQITEKKFNERYASNPIDILVSFAPDGVSEPQTITGYGYGLDAWYILQNA